MQNNILISKPKTKKGKDTLEKIEKAAVFVFYEKGYHNTSISDIVLRAGVAIGTFYIYFDSKQNLYRYLLSKCDNMIKENLIQLARECNDCQEINENSIVSSLDFVNNNKYILHIFWEAYFIEKQMFDKIYEDLIEEYLSILEDAKKHKLINPDIDCKIILSMLIGTINLLELNMGIFEENSNTVEQGKQIMKALSQGIFTS